MLDALRKGTATAMARSSSASSLPVCKAPRAVVSGKCGSGQVVTSETDCDKQSARFDSRGEDFVVARRLRIGATH